MNLTKDQSRSPMGQARNLIEKYTGYQRHVANDIVKNLTTDECEAIKNASSDPATAEDTIIDIVADAEERGLTGVPVEGERTEASQEGPPSLSARDLQARNAIERHAGKDRAAATAVVRSLSQQDRQNVRAAKRSGAGIQSIVTAAERRR